MPLLKHHRSHPDMPAWMRRLPAQWASRSVHQCAADFPPGTPRHVALSAINQRAERYRSSAAKRRSILEARADW